jgi:very-short-patch-repair endonuclease
MGSEPEEALAFLLKVNKIPFGREQKVSPERRWRFDFVLDDHIAVEVDGGSHSGGHRHHGEADKECEKLNTAVLLGWKVLHVTPAMVENGVALRWIEVALGRRDSL